MKLLAAVLTHAFILNSPASADTPSGQPAVSSQPVTQNGLSLSTSLTKKSFAAGEPISVTVEITNVSDKDIPLYRTNFDDLRFIDLATKKVWVTQASLFPPPAMAPPSLQPLKPKEILRHEVKVTRFVEAGGKVSDFRTGLPAGRYRLEYSTAFIDHHPEKRRPIYTGTLKAAAIEFEVLPAK